MKRFFSDTLFFAASNVLTLAMSGVVALLLPKYLPVDDYGYYKLFFLYISYVNMLHLGFINGVYVRWAGKDIADIRQETGIALRFLLLEQVVVMMSLALLFHFVVHGSSYRLIAFLLLPAMLVNNVKDLFNRAIVAARGFRFLSIIGVAFSILSTAGGLALVFSGRLDFWYFVGLSLVMSLVNLAAMRLYLGRAGATLGVSLRAVLEYGKRNIQLGIFLMLAFLSSVLIMSLDRLLVSSFFAIDAFAVYAFAMSLLAIVLALITPVSEVLLPHLAAVSEGQRQRAYCLVKPVLIIIWGATLALSFPMSLLVRFYLPAYSDSLIIFQVLFCSVGFWAVIQMVHQTCYMVYRKQQRFLLWAFTMLCVAAGLDILAIKVAGTLLSVAVAAVIGIAMYYVLNERELWKTLNETRFQMVRDFGMMLCYIGAFWLSKLVVGGDIAPMFVYLAVFSLMTWLAFRSEAGTVAAMVRLRVVKRSVT